MNALYRTCSGRFASGLAALLITLTVLSGCQNVTSHGVVAVRAMARPVHDIAGSAATAAPRSFAFVEGRYFPSMFDADVKKVDFAALTKQLGADLQPRLVPAASLDHADLVIVVQWGAVMAPESSIDNLMFDPDSVRQAQEAVETSKVQATADFKAGNYLASQQVGVAQSNLDRELLNARSIVAMDARTAANAADIIGLRGLPEASGTTAEADALHALLEEDRYFVNLVALDASALRLKIKTVVWSTRMSVPVSGLDFAAALRRMSSAAARYYGTNEPHMILQSTVTGASAQAIAPALGR